MKNKTAGL